MDKTKLEIQLDAIEITENTVLTIRVPDKYLEDQVDLDEYLDSLTNVIGEDVPIVVLPYEFEPTMMSIDNLKAFLDEYVMNDDGTSELTSQYK